MLELDQRRLFGRCHLSAGTLEVAFKDLEEKEGTAHFIMCVARMQTQGVESQVRNLAVQCHLCSLPAGNI